MVTPVQLKRPLPMKGLYWNEGVALCGCSRSVFLLFGNLPLPSLSRGESRTTNPRRLCFFCGIVEQFGKLFICSKIGQSIHHSTNNSVMDRSIPWFCSASEASAVTSMALRYRTFLHHQLQCLEALGLLDQWWSTPQSPSPYWGPSGLPIYMPSMCQEAFCSWMTCSQGCRSCWHFANGEAVKNKDTFIWQTFKTSKGSNTYFLQCIHHAMAEDTTPFVHQGELQHLEADLRAHE